MRKGFAVTWVVLVSLVGVVAACTPPPSGSGTPPADVPCSDSDHVVRVHGDSLAFHIARAIDAPGRTVMDRTTARASLSFDLPENAELGLPAVSSIVGTVRDRVDRCGVPEVLVIQGGINDLASNVPVTDIEAAVSDLSDWLEARDVPTVWMTIHPLPTAGTYMWVQPARQAYNAWLKAGNVHGIVADCVPYLDDPAHPDTMAPAYWWQVDIWGTIEGVHPNQAGYDQLGRCISDALPPTVG